MRRPEILRRTYETFSRNLKGVEFAASTLHLNIDPTPADADSLECVAVAHEFFGHVEVHEPDEPNFAKAVKWCFAQPRGEFFFHLEDDWTLEREISIGELMGFLTEIPGLSVVNLRGYPYAMDYLCLGPGLWRRQHAAEIGQKLRYDFNPEMQLRTKDNVNIYGGVHVGYLGYQWPRVGAVVKDIGRSWLREAGLRKWPNDRDFVEWKADERATQRNEKAVLPSNSIQTA
jgi:hypothetical protein